jgi:hypothetical protein
MSEQDTSRSEVASWAPGWYPYPRTGRMTWWDGHKWTDHRHPSEAPPPSNKNAVGSFVFGLIGGILSLIPLLGIFLGALLGFCALVAGIVALAQASKYANRGNGFAVTGILFAIGAFVVVSVQWTLLSNSG